MNSPSLFLRLFLLRRRWRLLWWLRRLGLLLRNLGLLRLLLLRNLLSRTRSNLFRVTRLLGRLRRARLTNGNLSYNQEHWHHKHERPNIRLLHSLGSSTI